MEGLEKQYFQIISAVGIARSSHIEAVREAKKVNSERAREMIEEGDRSSLQRHEAHVEITQQEAGSEKTKAGLLLIHAEGQLMSMENFKIIADEMIQNYERTITLESKIK